MRYVFGQPSRHPTAWLTLVAGLLILVFVYLTGNEAGTGPTGLLMGLAFTALGIAELLPRRLQPVSVVLRLVGLLLAAVMIVISVAAIIS